MNVESLLKFFILYYFLGFLRSNEALVTSIITYEYFSPLSNYTTRVEENQTDGIVASRFSQVSVFRRPSFSLVDSNGNFYGCQQTTNSISVHYFVAIIQRGGNCTFSVKISRAKQLGASGKR